MAIYANSEIYNHRKLSLDHEANSLSQINAFARNHPSDNSTPVEQLASFVMPDHFTHIRV